MKIKKGILNLKIELSIKEIADLVVALQGQPRKKGLLKGKTSITLDGTNLYQAVRKANGDKV